jgi:hypothetical protein
MTRPQPYTRPIFIVLGTGAALAITVILFIRSIR